MGLLLFILFVVALMVAPIATMFVLIIAVPLWILSKIFGAASFWGWVIIGFIVLIWLL